MLQVGVFCMVLVCSAAHSLSLKTHKHPEILGLVTKRGYPCEKHHVTTSDGYILTLYRLPHGRANKTISNRPVLVQHGTYSSSDMYLISEPTYGLGYILADNGYDVWLGNCRGNHHARNHTTLNPDLDQSFWHFSWHEMGTYDLPVTIDYILKVTSQAQLHYVGHSQGSTIFYVLATTRPEYNAKIKAQVSLGPPVYMRHTRDVVARAMAVLLTNLTRIIENRNINEVGSGQQFPVNVFRALCPRFRTTCSKIFPIFFGMNPRGMSADLATFLRFSPAGASVRQMLHFVQGVKSKCFRWYDHGEDNRDVYGSESPPMYNVSLVTAPSYLFCSSGDLIAAEKDVSRLCEDINGACFGKFLIPDDSMSHVDLIMSKKAPELVFLKMLSVMEEH